MCIYLGSIQHNLCGVSMYPEPNFKTLIDANLNNQPKNTHRTGVWEFYLNLTFNVFQKKYWPLEVYSVLFIKLNRLGGGGKYVFFQSLSYEQLMFRGHASPKHVFQWLEYRIWYHFIYTKNLSRLNEFGTYSNHIPSKQKSLKTLH